VSRHFAVPVLTPTLILHLCVILDNIAPPVASCLGDLVTLSLLTGVSYLYTSLLHAPFILAIIIVAIFVGAIGWVVLANKNPHVKPLLREGWLPLFGAMIISNGTGAVLDTFAGRYTDYGLLAVANTSGFRFLTTPRMTF